MDKVYVCAFNLLSQLQPPFLFVLCFVTQRTLTKKNQISSLPVLYEFLQKEKTRGRLEAGNFMIIVHVIIASLTALTFAMTVTFSLHNVTTIRNILYIKLYIIYNNYRYTFLSNCQTQQYCQPQRYWHINNILLSGFRMPSL